MFGLKNVVVVVVVDGDGGAVKSGPRIL